MKRTRLFCLCLSALAGTCQLAQGYIGDGYLLSRFRTYTAELPLLSSLDNGFGTARSSAMGGAYASLGADLSSITINPAGLGLYRSSEIGLSPAVTISQYRNSGPIAINGKGDSKAAFKPNNLGLALNMGQYSRSMTSFTFGFSYTRLADYNYNSSVSLATDRYSLAQIQALQLWGIPSSNLDINSSPWINGLHPNLWGAALAYQTGMVGVHPIPEDTEWQNKPSNDPNKWPSMFQELYGRTYYAKGTGGPSSLSSHDMRTVSKGSKGEYNIAGGFDFGSNVYFGFSLGLMDLYQKQNITYTENYTNNDSENPARSMTYLQQTKITGSGVNVKLGVIVNPVEGLRVGLAVHTPTWNVITKDYTASMGAVFPSGSYGRNTDIWTYEYKYNTPARGTLGLSYTFGDKGLISVDYGCDFYNWMRIRVPGSDRYYEVDGVIVDEFKELKADVKADYKPRHIVRVGGEFKPLPEFSLRAGFAYQSSFLKDNDAIFNEPLPYQSMNISGGLGYRFNNHISLDLAYVFMKTDYTDYDLYHYNGPDNTVNGKTYIGYEDAISSKLDRHNIIMTFGYRF